MDGHNTENQQGNHSNEESSGTAARSRRRFLKVAGSTAALTTLAGCSSQGSNGGNTSTSGATPVPDSTTSRGQATTAESTATDTSSTESATTTSQQPLLADDLMNIEEWRGSGPQIESRPNQYANGTSVLELPDLSGELTVYLGGGEGGLYQNLMKRIQGLYENFSVNIRLAGSSQLANTIIEESSASSSPADIFWAIDAGSIGVVASEGATQPLPDRVRAEVPDTYAPSNDWVGIMGRARCITYNTNTFNAEQIPQDIFQFAEQSRFNDAMGWAPTYGAFQAFITAMRLLNSDQRAQEWLTGMQEQGIQTYDNELLVANAVASGELSAGFTNHYYSRLVFEERPDAPIGLAFTQADAGSLVNCSGTEIIRGSQNQELAANFIHHLLSIEAQEFLCTRGYEYPLVPSVPPVGNLPTIDQLSPPEFNLGNLSDLEPTLQLLRETGAL